MRKNLDIRRNFPLKQRIVRQIPPVGTKGVMSIAAIRWWFVIWLGMVVFFGTLWIIVQHGRELWGRIQAVYSHPVFVEYWRKIENTSEERDRLDDGTMASGEGDQGK